MRKLLAQDVGGVGLQTTNERRGCPGRIALDQQADMIRPDLQRVNRQPLIGHLLAQEDLQACRHDPDEHGAAIFGHHTTW